MAFKCHPLTLSQMSVAMCAVVIRGEAIDLKDTFSNVCDQLTTFQNSVRGNHDSNLIAFLFFRVADLYEPSSTQASPDKFGGVSSYSPCLFGKGIVVHARQTYLQQTKTFTKTKLI